MSEIGLIARVLIAGVVMKFPLANPFVRTPIWVKLTVFVSALVLLCAGALALLVGKVSQRAVEREVVERLTVVATLRQQQILAHVNYLQATLHQVSTRISISTGLGAYKRSHSNRPKHHGNTVKGFNQSQSQSQAVSFNQSMYGLQESMKESVLNSEDMVVLGAYGINRQIVHSVFSRENRSRVRLPKTLPYEIATSFKRHASTVAKQPPGSTDMPKVSWMGDPYEGLNGSVFIDVAAPVYEKREYCGVLLASVDVKKFRSMVYDSTGLQQSGQLLIGYLKEDGKTVSFLFPPAKSPKSHNTTFQGQVFLPTHGRSGFEKGSNFLGKNVASAFRPVGYKNWGLAAMVEQRELYASSTQLWYMVLGAMACIFAIGVLASYVAAKLFSRHIVHLRDVSTLLGQGDLSARAKRCRRCYLVDEIDDLCCVFNGMADQIAAACQDMERKVEERTRDIALANQQLSSEVCERKRMEGELQVAKDAAVAADKAKSAWLASMSHEIRTPLNGIINCTQLCRSTQVNQEQEEYLDLALSSAKHLLHLISDILDFSKIEAGKVQLERVSFCIQDQMEQAGSVLANQAHAKGISLVAGFVDSHVPEKVMGDPSRLFQILVNLIGNAVKFTDHGEVVLSASSTAEQSDHNIEVHFSVRDTGIGIPLKKQALLFQAFSQLHASDSRLYGGTGLGLAISARLAEAMGGRMWVESEEGRGSTFHFTAVLQTLPISTASEASEFHCNPPGMETSVSSDRSSVPTPVHRLSESTIVDSFRPAQSRISQASRTMEGFRAIILDESQACRCYVAAALQAVGMETEEASNAAEALVIMYDAKESSRSFNLLVSDLRLLADHSNELTHHGTSDGTQSPLASPCSGVDISSPGQEKYKWASEFLREIRSETLLTGVGVVTSVNGQKLEEGTSPLVTFPVVMMCSADPTDTAVCKSLGIDRYITKPIKRKQLQKRVFQVLGSNAAVPEKGGLSATSSLASEDLEASRPLHVLVAEDNVVNQKVAMAFLRKWGHEASLAANGEEAVRMAKENTYDAILMDVHMPVCNGLEATQRIRTTEKLLGKHTPIIAMTAQALIGDGARCIEAGMDCYMTKPLNAVKLQQLLASIAQHHELRRPTGSGLTSSQAH